MTISTTVNSLLLTFGPLLATYHGFNLKEHRAYGATILGGLAFLLTQIVKFILLAVLASLFFSHDDYEDEDSGNKSLFIGQDILKCVIDVVDLFGLYYLLNQKKLVSVSGEPYLKILAVSIGWAAAELLFSNLLNIIFLY